MFLGEFLHSIDEKGRLKLPAKFKDAFVDGGVVTEGFEGSLALYTMVDFPREAAKYRELETFDPNNRQLRRDAFAGAETVSLDKAGRMGVPLKMRDIVKPGEEVFVTGNWDHLEIWPKGVWQQYRAEARQKREINAGKLAKK